MTEQQEDKMDSSTVKKLVNRIKACTFLPYLNKCDWSVDVISSIEEFVSTDRQMICLFYENDILKATFCIPDARTDSIMWFLKTTNNENTQLNNTNFLKLISFGKMDTQVEKTMFLLLDSLYSPFIFSWSASEKDQFFEQYRAVIQELCSLRYKFLGMPSIYIPTIVGNFNETSKSVSEETLKVLENILNVYTLEIQTCLMDTERVPTKCEYMMEHIIDEIDYWKTRLRNLRFITTLLSYKSVEEILTILNQHQSILVHSFNNAINEIKAAKIEAKSNLNYLQILWDPVMSLYDVKSPNDILTRLPDIFVKFIFIFEESQYYNKWSDITRLYEYLGNQIVYICRKTIKISELFSGNTESVLNKLQISMNCCENFISIYTKVIEIYNSKNDGHWSVETKDMHMFLDRCKDVNYICKSIILFKRMNGKHPLPKPKFSFTKGLEFEKVMESIELKFNKLISNLENVQNLIFNVNTTDWYQHELEFKNEVKELCNIVEQLLNDAMSITCNIEDALNVLQSLHYFSNWPQLKSYFQKKTNDVYAMLIEDISLAMQFYTDNSYQIPSFMIKYSGVCITAMTEYKRIETLKNMISERPWLLPCSNNKKLHELYKNYTIAYQELLNNTIESWNNQSNINYEKKLDKYILVGNQNEQFWHLTINMDW
ncbi:uncharacterized protein LOC132916899 [Rhopalosiphum padi]|uniref:uncharacterized protein LOC132916899 n=1 Tax=Rhopalosiphum padi TaxID=40932 RepID=UPI00298D95DF|nr:uncharacterized protein LOC132916899 [Rhopalosiphum padi]